MIVAFTIAFTISWECTLIVMGGFPVVMIAMVISIKAGQAGIKDGLIAYQQCAGLAEQSLQSVKVVQTYGREELESKNYNKYLVRTFDVAKAANFFK